MPLTARDRTAQSKYRADVDGLRAVAVLAVVVCHALPHALPGGFIGVDVFFVISGFLISTILFDSLERGEFTFLDFYARRIRRIFPALLLVLIACTSFGSFALLVDEYKQLGKHLAGAAGFVSNYVLWGESGYFDRGARTKPLLHLWSLGVEEQFYVFWPPVLWLAWKRHLNPLILTAIVGGASFVLNVAIVNRDSVAAFYSPQTRGWELMAGALVACLARRPRLDDPMRRNLQSAFGAALLVTGLLVTTKRRAFPGWWAVLPTAGAALVILAGGQAWLNRVVLSNCLLVWLGLLSFPLYLWHWPLLSFARIIMGGPTSRAVNGAAVAAAVVLAWLTYRWIERPVRFSTTTKVVPALLFLAMVALGGFGYRTYRGSRSPSIGTAASPAVVADGDFEGDSEPLAYLKYAFHQFYVCTPPELAQDAMAGEGVIRCWQSQRRDAVDIVLIGDSHAEHLFVGLAEQLPGKNIAMYTKNSVPSVDNPAFATSFRYVLSSKTIKKVIVTMFWSEKLDQIPAGRTLKSDMLRTAEALLRSGKEVYFTDDLPAFPFDVENCQTKRLLGDQPRRCTIAKEEYARTAAPSLAMVHDIIRQEPRIRLLETAKYFCDCETCSMTRGHKMLYRDESHLTVYGSQYLGQKIVGAQQDLADY